MSGYPTVDATVLEFDFMPDADKVFFQYVFGSEKYNDVFAFFINIVLSVTGTLQNGNQQAHK